MATIAFIILTIILYFHSLQSVEVKATELATHEFRDDEYVGKAEADENGDYLIDDMILSAEEYNSMYNNRIGIKSSFKRWPGKKIIYKFDEVFQPHHLTEFYQCVKDVEESTCIRFKERTTESTYIYVTNNISKGCISSVGFQNKVQKINIALKKNCTRYGTICHEMLHAIGLAHEHCSYNRDKYVFVDYANINPSNYLAFKKVSSAYYSEYGIPYCFESLMHYRPKSFSINDKDTIFIREPYKSRGKTIGFRTKIGDCDAARINAMYKCPKKKV